MPGTPRTATVGMSVDAADDTFPEWLIEFAKSVHNLIGEVGLDRVKRFVHEWALTCQGENGRTVPPRRDREYTSYTLAEKVAALAAIRDWVLEGVEPVYPWKKLSDDDWGDNYRRHAKPKLRASDLFCQVEQNRLQSQHQTALEDWLQDVRDALLTEEGAVSRSSRGSKQKQSTAKGEAQIKLISAFTAHHKWENGKCCNSDPIGCNELARKAEVSKDRASVFFKKWFGRHGDYKAVCRRDPDSLDVKIAKMNTDLLLRESFGSTPADKLANKPADE